MESDMVAPVLDDVEFSGFQRVCDIGGGHGHLLCTLLREEPGDEGIVLELPDVVQNDDEHWHEPMDLEDRVEFVAGDFFQAVPSADAYLLKHILHDWNDAECIDILSTIREAAPEGPGCSTVSSSCQSPGNRTFRKSSTSI
jgi:hypothetical protein